MNIVIVGKLVAALDPHSGTGRNGAWFLQEFLVEMAEIKRDGTQYPTKILFTIDNEEHAQQLCELVGHVITAYCSVKAYQNMVNGKWYNNCKAFSVREGAHSTQA